MLPCKTITRELQIADFCEEIVMSSLPAAMTIRPCGERRAGADVRTVGRLKLVHLDASAGAAA
jgi:hypothetical protein